MRYYVRRPFLFFQTKKLMEITACTCRNFFGLFFSFPIPSICCWPSTAQPRCMLHTAQVDLWWSLQMTWAFSTNNKWKKKRIVSVVHPDVFIFLSLGVYTNKKKRETPSYHDKPPIFATVHSRKCPCCSCVFLRLSSASIPTSPVFLFILIHSARLYVYIHTSSDYITLIK